MLVINGLIRGMRPESTWLSGLITQSAFKSAHSGSSLVLSFCSFMPTLYSVLLAGYRSGCAFTRSRFSRSHKAPGLINFETPREA